MSIDDRARPAWLPAPHDPPTVELPRVTWTPPAPAPVPPRRWSPGLVAALVISAVLLGVVLIIGLGSLTGAFDRSFAVNGTLDLDSQCATAYTGYDDIHAGTAVTVKDAAGTIVASGNLGSGVSGGYGSCEFSFIIPAVPSGSDFYQVEVSHRGGVTFPAEQIRNSGAALHLG